MTSAAGCLPVESAVRIWSRMLPLWARWHPKLWNNAGFAEKCLKHSNRARDHLANERA
jgi:hypothetical protein